jgi:hypothetical protein
MTLLLLAACAPVVEPEPTPAAQLGVLELLARASLDARAMRPTEAEIVLVEADPDALSALLDDYVASDAFPERLVPLYNEVLRTRTDRFLASLDNDMRFVDEAYNLAFRHAVGEEPLRMFWYVAEHDLPYTEVVTADYTVANDMMLAHLPMEAVDDGEGWRRARYLDDRPAAGILGTTGFYWRYTSTFENANRGRAQAMARSLLCDGRFEAAVSFQGATSGLSERTRTDPTCTSCHGSLDPLAAHFWGFMWRNQEAWLEVTTYDSSRVAYWTWVTEVGPGYYGAPSEGLHTLGDTLAADPRLVNCAVETGMKFWLREKVTMDDAEAFKDHREAFLAGGLTLRALYRSFLEDGDYRAADRGDDATRPRTLRPDQLAGSIEALTGYRWTWGGNDMLDVDEIGVRILSGGVDGFIVSEPSPDPSTTTLLVQERVAEAAAAYAVDNESSLDADARILFREIDLADADPASDALTAQIVALYLRIHTRRLAADDEDVMALVEFWKERALTSDPATAWEDVLIALFRHPDFNQY